MKLLISFMIFFTVILYPQGRSGGTFPDCELNIQVQNTDGFVTFVLTPIGANWANNIGCVFPLYNDNTTWVSTFTDFDNNHYEDCNLNGYTYRFYNEGSFREVTGCALRREPEVDLVPIRNGFYRIDVWENDIIRKYVYFDWRDASFTMGQCTSPSCWGGNDMTIRYDVLRDELWFWRALDVPISNQNPEEVLNQGQIINWADRNCTQRTTTYLDNFWEHALVGVNDGNDHPLLVWGPYPDVGSLIGTITGYKIFRSASHNAGQPPSNFSLIETVDADEFEYVDNSVTMGGGYNAKSYYVTCIYEDPKEGVGETGPTNTVEVRLEIPEKRGITGNYLTHSFEYKLKQNYPNPFNPITQLDYTINFADRVTVKVYDVLGNEVALLVNEEKQPGNYSVTFDASNLPSGIYVYRIVSGKFQAAKKMILMK